MVALTALATASLDAAYAQATPEQVARGRSWYADMRSECAGIAVDTGHALDRVVATAAITSPAARLTTNLAWTREACASNGRLLVGRYPNNMAAKYRPILAGTVAPEQGVGGLKVTSFYRAIMGDSDAIVVDRWMLRACGHTKDTCTDKQYLGFAAMIREAADRAGERPADFQAIVWIVLRDRAERADGVRQGLTDLREAA